MNKTGQTLIEVMVALFVLTAGFLGILSLLSQSLAISKTTSEDTIATYLAEEGIELAKNAVDHDMYQRIASSEGSINVAGWGQGNADPTFLNGGDYQLDYTFCDSIAYDASCGQATPQTNPPAHLCFDPSTNVFDPSANLYNYGCGAGTVVTPYTRDIRVKYGQTSDGSTDDNVLIVDSNVQWSSGLTSQSIDLQDYFYNWHP